MRLQTPSRAAGLLTIAVVLVVASTMGAQQLSGTGTPDQTAQLVSQMISKYHISQKQIDDKTSQMLLKRMFKELDPQKLYFLQSDVDELSKYRDHLDDFVKQGNVDFSRQMFDLYRTRLDDRIAMAHKLIDSPHDFSLEENMSTDGDQLPWAADAKELNERWRKRIKYDLLLQRLEKTAPDEAVKKLHKRYDTLKKTVHEMDELEVLEMYLSSLAHCFDPHSSYMSRQTLEEFEIAMRLSLEGIGAQLKSEDGFTTVAQVVPGGAAEKDGRLKVGDKIIAVGQAEGDWVDIIEMKLSRVVRLIRGDRGTKVRLKVVNGAGETVEYTLVRQTIEIKSSEVKGEIIEAGKWVNGAAGRIGVIDIPSFYRDFGGAQQGLDNFKSTARDVHKVLDQFRAQGGVDVVVVDLRMNGGGALSEAIEVSGLFIDKGPIVQVKELNGRTKSHDDTEPGAIYEGPLVVLCNRLSASASEIFAAAIKDYNRGIVIGDTTTHGKGTVQNVMPVSSQLFRLLDSNQKGRGALKLTINQFYRVNGDSTQNKGVESDIVIPSLIDHMDLGESYLENALAFDRVEPVRHVIYDMVTPALVTTLRDSSQRRVAVDAKFADVKKDIDRFVARKNRKAVSLNEETLRKEREEDKAADDVAKEEEDKATAAADAPVFAETDYNKEVLRIALDYVQQLRQIKTAAR
jgi:carboxyl-terminal processing protease